jgi:phage-related baseplate assembly protein
MTPSLFTSIDLSTVPPPKLDSPDYEAILAENVALFASLSPGYTMLLESDPVSKLLEAFSYKQLLLVEYANTRAMANLLPFSSGGDLDQLAAFYDVVRLTDETDDAFRYRIQAKQSAGKGGAQHYKYWALTADPRVLDAVVYSTDGANGYNMGGSVTVAILSNEFPDYRPSSNLLAVVNDQLRRDDVKILTDIVNVVPAKQISAKVQAEVMLLSSAPYTTIATAKAALVDAFNKAQAIGRDLTQSWIMSTLMVTGVHSVKLVSPSSDLIAEANEYITLDDVTLTFTGYADHARLGVQDSSAATLLNQANAYYVAYAIEHKRTQQQIMDDLAAAPVEGIIQPTIAGLIAYLNISGATDVAGNLLPEDQLAFLIWYTLSPQYGA